MNISYAKQAIGQEAERQRIAKELHDGLGQSLTAIRLNLNTLEADFDKFNQQSTVDTHRRNLILKLDAKNDTD